MKAVALLTILLLAACGADGAPEAPASKSGISLTGEAQVGVVLR